MFGASEDRAPRVPERDAATAGRICFLCPKCVLDPSSGAAISVRNILRALADRGHFVTTFTASLFDANGEVAFGPVLGKQAQDSANAGKLCKLTDRGIDHFVFLTRSSRRKNLTPEEGRLFQRLWLAWLARYPQDILLTFESSAMARSMVAAARQAGTQVVHYLGNAETTTAQNFLPDDRVITPSRFLQAHYRDVLGIEPQVLRPIMPTDLFIAPEDAAVVNTPSNRRLGFVTFVNPLPHKGLTLFAQLVRRASSERPDMRFLVIEGRMPQDVLRAVGIDLGAARNVWLIPTQQDVAEIYRRTTVLLVPSFWREGISRSVVEAQLSGVPVIASARGGIPEALNGGGTMLDVPRECTENYLAVPDADTVERWWQALVRLWDDDEAYREAVARAREAGSAFHPAATAPRAVSYFDALLAARS